MPEAPQGLGFRGLEFRVLLFRVWGLELREKRLQDCTLIRLENLQMKFSGRRTQGSGCRIEALESRVWGSGWLRVPGCRGVAVLLPHDCVEQVYCYRDGNRLSFPKLTGNFLSQVIAIR